MNIALTSLTVNADLTVKEISEQLEFSTTSKTYTNDDLKNRQYIDVYIRTIGSDALSRITRIYANIGTGQGVGVTIVGITNYHTDMELLYDSDSGTLTYRVTSTSGWPAETFRIQHIWYQN